MIDWTRIDTLREEIGVDCLQEVVDLFLEEVDDSIARLRHADPAPEPGARLGPELHFLKGCALNLGFADFASLCQTAETACAQDQSALVDLATILACYDTSRAAFVVEFPERCGFSVRSGNRP